MRLRGSSKHASATESVSAYFVLNLTCIFIWVVFKLAVICEGASRKQRGHFYFFHLNHNSQILWFSYIIVKTNFWAKVDYDSHSGFWIVAANSFCSGTVDIFILMNGTIKIIPLKGLCSVKLSMQGADGRWGSFTMPLLRRKAFALVEPPEDLKLDEQVYTIRYTKEIFRDYPYPL